MMKQEDYVASDGKSVEYETPQLGTNLATIRVKYRGGVPELGIVIPYTACSPPPLPPVTLDPSFLQQHPKPGRAEYLWAKNPHALLSLM
jgi:hypothetical protein